MESDYDTSVEWLELAGLFALAAVALARSDRKGFDLAVGQGLKQLDSLMDQKAAAG